QPPSDEAQNRNPSAVSMFYNMGLWLMWRQKALIQSGYLFEIGDGARVSRRYGAGSGLAQLKPCARGMRQECAFSPDQCQMPAYIGALDPVYAHAWMMPLFRNHSRQEADAHACRNKLHDEINLTGADSNVGRKSVRTTSVEDDMVEGKTALEEDEGQAGDILQRNAVALRRRVAGRKQRNNRFASH